MQRRTKWPESSYDRVMRARIAVADVFAASVDRVYQREESAVTEATARFTAAATAAAVTTRVSPFSAAKPFGPLHGTAESRDASGTTNTTAAVAAAGATLRSVQETEHAAATVARNALRAAEADVLRIIQALADGLPSLHADDVEADGDMFLVGGGSGPTDYGGMDPNASNNALLMARIHDLRAKCMHQETHVAGLKALCKRKDDAMHYIRTTLWQEVVVLRESAARQAGNPHFSNDFVSLFDYVKLLEGDEASSYNQAEVVRLLRKEHAAETVRMQQAFGQQLQQREVENGLLTNEVARLRRTIASADGRLDGTEASPILSRGSSAIGKSATALEEQIRTLQQELVRRAEQLADITRATAEKQAEWDRSAATIAGYKSQLQRVSSELEAAVELKDREIIARTHQAQEAEARCRVLEQSRAHSMGSERRSTELQSQLLQTSLDLSSAEQKVSALQMQRDEATKNVERLKSENDQLRSAGTDVALFQIASLQKQIAKLEGNLANKERERSVLADKADTLETALDSLREAQENVGKGQLVARSVAVKAVVENKRDSTTPNEATPSQGASVSASPLRMTENAALVATAFEEQVIEQERTAASLKELLSVSNAECNALRAQLTAALSDRGADTTMLLAEVGELTKQRELAVKERDRLKERVGVLTAQEAELKQAAHHVGHARLGAVLVATARSPLRRPVESASMEVGQGNASPPRPKANRRVAAASAAAAISGTSERRALAFSNASELQESEVTPTAVIASLDDTDRRKSALSRGSSSRSPSPVSNPSSPSHRENATAAASRQAATTPPVHQEQPQHPQTPPPTQSAGQQTHPGPQQRKTLRAVVAALTATRGGAHGRNNGPAAQPTKDETSARAEELKSTLARLAKAESEATEAKNEAVAARAEAAASEQRATALRQALLEATVGPIGRTECRASCAASTEQSLPSVSPRSLATATPPLTLTPPITPPLTPPPPPPSVAISEKPTAQVAGSSVLPQATCSLSAPPSTSVSGKNEDCCGPRDAVDAEEALSTAADPLSTVGSPATRHLVVVVFVLRLPQGSRPALRDRSRNRGISDAAVYARALVEFARRAGGAVAETHSIEESEDVVPGVRAAKRHGQGKESGVDVVVTAFEAPSAALAFVFDVVLREEVSFGGPAQRRQGSQRPRPSEVEVAAGVDFGLCPVEEGSAFGPVPGLALGLALAARPKTALFSLAAHEKCVTGSTSDPSVSSSLAAEGATPQMPSFIPLVNGDASETCEAAMTGEGGDDGFSEDPHAAALTAAVWSQRAGSPDVPVTFVNGRLPLNCATGDTTVAFSACGVLRPEAPVAQNAVPAKLVSKSRTTNLIVGEKESPHFAERARLATLLPSPSAVVREFLPVLSPSAQLQNEHLAAVRQRLQQQPGPPRSGKTDASASQASLHRLPPRSGGDTGSGDADRSFQDATDRCRQCGARISEEQLACLRAATTVANREDVACQCDGAEPLMPSRSSVFCADSRARPATTNRPGSSGGVTATASVSGGAGDCTGQDEVHVTVPSLELAPVAAVRRGFGLHKGSAQLRHLRSAAGGEASAALAASRSDEPAFFVSNAQQQSQAQSQQQQQQSPHLLHAHRHRACSAGTRRRAVPGLAGGIENGKDVAGATLPCGFADSSTIRLVRGALEAQTREPPSPPNGDSRDTDDKNSGRAGSPTSAAGPAVPHRQLAGTSLGVHWGRPSSAPAIAESGFAGEAATGLDVHRRTGSAAAAVRVERPVTPQAVAAPLGYGSTPPTIDARKLAADVFVGTGGTVVRGVRDRIQQTVNVSKFIARYGEQFFRPAPVHASPNTTPFVATKAVVSTPAEGPSRKDRK